MDRLEGKVNPMSDYCECSTKDQVVMTDGGVHRWTGDTLRVPSDWTANPRLPVSAHPDMLNNRRPGCGKPRPEGLDRFGG